MKTKFLLLLLALLTIPGISAAAEMRTLEIEFAFTSPEPDKSLVGYRLYKQAVQVCETTDANVTIISCDMLTEDGTFDFTLSAYYSDNTESPLSPAFPYTIGTTTVTPPPVTVPVGSKIITYSWDQNLSSADLAGYRMYMNDALLCATADPLATTLSCTADLINAPMAFTVASYDINGIESPRSNILLLDPADYPDLFQTRSLTFNWDYTDSPANAGGFRIYDNGGLLCQTADYTARQLTCESDLSAPTHIFTMTAVDGYSVETAVSNAITYNAVNTDSSTTVPDFGPLQAVITPTPSIGEAPLSVSFAGTNSTGDIATYSWQFGDGTSAEGSVASHTYTIPGTYSATLLIKDPSGATSLATTSITAQPVIQPPPTPPTAVLSSSTAAGNAPLTVSFDGTASTTPNPPMVSYSWTFGDGSQAAGMTASHTYTTAGTYYAELTVTDSLGLTAKVDTPVVVLTAAIANEKPTAVISADQTGGDAPLIVSFDGSQSSDPDGTISRYDWNFGDGTTATGPTAQHTYTDAATYTMSLQVTDNLGLTAVTTRQITCTSALLENAPNFEAGEISIDHQWVRVLFENSFNQPIVVAGPPTFNGTDPVLVRIRNIDQEGFDVRLQEWDYLDGSHATETFSYLVMEKGVYTLDSGMKIEAGSFTGSTRFQTITLQQTYDITPVILSQVITENETDAVTGRTQNTGQTSFEYMLQEQETTKNKHTTETIGYIAWETGKGEIRGLLFEAGLTPRSVTHNWFDLAFQTAFPDQPLFIANMQTYAGSDTSTVRSRNMSQTATQVKIEEEQSKDAETDHATETVGYLLIGSKTAAAEKLITFTWEYGDTQNISGFRFYLNGSLLCETTNPDDRQISCVSATQDTANSFSMTAVELTGTETSPSNEIQYNP